MKSTLQLLLVALVIGAVLIAPVAAATSQGLEWGVANADRFSYQVTAHSETEDLSEGMYIDVEGAPDVIPNIVTTWAELPTVNIGAYWDNDTSIGLFFFVFLFMGLTGEGVHKADGNGLNFFFFKEVDSIMDILLINGS